MKAAALILGPVGMGMIGIYQSLLATTSVVAGLGIQQTGQRALSIANTDLDRKSNVVQSALNFQWVVTSLIAAALFIIFREEISTIILEDSARSKDVVILSLGIFFTIGGWVVTAVFSAKSRMDSISWMTATSSVLSLLVSIVILIRWKDNAVVVFVFLMPLFNTLYGTWKAKFYSGTAKIIRSKYKEVKQEVFRNLNLGVSIMISTLMVTAGLFGVRLVIQTELSLATVGLFTATTIISLHCINFLMSSTSYDFYPKLVASVGNSEESNSLLNFQIESMMLLCAPIFFIVISFSEEMLTILYSSEFIKALVILQLVIIGDSLRAFSYPLSFLFLATAAKGSYFSIRFIEGIAFLILLYFLIPQFGIVAIGLSYLIGYILVFIFSVILAHRITNYWPSNFSLCLLFLSLLVSGLLYYGQSILGVVIFRCTAIGVTLMWMAYLLKHFRR